MKVFAFGSFVVMFVAGVCSLAPAQKTHTAKSDPAHILHFDVAVHDASGMPVQGLRESDFAVLDNGADRPIASFNAVANNKQTSMAIILDAVNTPVSAVSFQRNQLIKFLRANGGRLAQPTSIGIFTDTEIRFSGQPTINGSALADALQHANIGLREVHRDAGFYGAEERMDTSLHALRVIVAKQSKLPGRKLVVWISPGWPLLSGAGVELSTRQQESLFANIIQYSAQLREAQITLYDVNTWGADESIDQSLYYEGFIKGVRKASQTDFGDLSLQVLALQSGGLVQNTNDLGKMLEKCEADAGAYYEISLRAPTFDKSIEYHALQIRMSKPDLKARTQQGYYVAP